MREQRRQTRLPFSAQALLRVHGDGRRYHLHVLDLSLKGALLDAPATDAPAPGAACAVELHLGEDQLVLHLEAEVVYCHDGRMGLRSTSIDLDSLAHLRRILELNLGDPNLLQREWREPEPG